MDFQWDLFGYTLAVFFISIIGGTVPFLIRLIKNKSIGIRIINIASVSASGLFLGGGIYHMLAEGLEMMDESGYSFGGYQLGWTLFGLTFFFIFFIDRVIVPHHHSSFEEISSDGSDDATNPKNEVFDDHTNLLIGDQPNVANSDIEDIEGFQNSNTKFGSKESSEEKSHHHHHHHHHHHEGDEKATKYQEWVGIIVLVSALSVHSFLEGLGLGSTNDYLMVFIAIAAHKWADSGLTILYLMKKLNGWIALVAILFIFSCFTPLGTLVGYFVITSLEDESVSLLVQGIFCCVAAGSFFFVAIVEILSEGFEGESNQYTLDKYLKFGLAVVFYIFMSLTTLLEPEEGSE
ncbi:zinc-iron transporter, putative [Entamoeba invadens IP1]|uniref:Zinc-iron transporter, putative n=1 Tax=Entamoeba invadens IP1 TaxID=370355 RepID=A0A0A1U1S6_ENTIV|nr:zinc-iron transporter, putative [Entamoeba invadens IP1]ELP86567.1 zinc-iron transporter, putative [Entamoeba invadens IP1]|eukprot:XP_004185913.1 zinc-iron transporter, putative [Entamoeba invadens IP1]